MPDLSHLWQRFLLASSLLFGLVLGVAATVFGYSNTAPVNVGFSIFHINGIPLWTVALIPLALVLVTGTVYHWTNSLHHFTEHMRHRRRVHELEVEVTSLRAHLDQLLEMPGQSPSKLPSQHVIEDVIPVTAEVESAPALPEPAAANGGKAPQKSRKRFSLSATSEPEPVASATTSVGVSPTKTEPSKEASAEA